MTTINMFGLDVDFEPIFEHLTSREKVQLELVCKVFYKLSRDGVLALELNGYTNERKLYASLDRFQNLESLEIKNFRVSEGEALSLPPKLKEIALSGRGNAIDGSVLTMFPEGARPFDGLAQLQKATFHGRLVLNDTLNSLPLTVTHLDLEESTEGSNFIKAIAHLTNLEMLKINKTAITDQGILEVVNVSMPNLKEIDLSGTYLSSAAVLNDHPNQGALTILGPTSIKVYSSGMYIPFTPPYAQLYKDNFN